MTNSPSPTPPGREGLFGVLILIIGGLIAVGILMWACGWGALGGFSG